MKKLKKTGQKDSDSKILKEKPISDPNKWQETVRENKVHEEVWNWIVFWGFILIFFSIAFSFTS